MKYRNFCLVLAWAMYFVAFMGAFMKEYTYGGFAMAAACFWAIQAQGRD